MDQATNLPKETEVRTKEQERISVMYNGGVNRVRTKEELKLSQEEGHVK
jgi:hypothetical protein